MARRVPKVAPAPEEPREQVERIVRRLACLSALPVLRDPVVSVLVVDLARVRRGQYVVGIGYIDEFLARGLVASIQFVFFQSALVSVAASKTLKYIRVLVRMELLAQRPIRLLDIFLRRGPAHAQDLVIVFRAQYQWDQQEKNPKEKLEETHAARLVLHLQLTIWRAVWQAS